MSVTTLNTVLLGKFWPESQVSLRHKLEERSFFQFVCVFKIMHVPDDDLANECESAGID